MGRSGVGGGRSGGGRSGGSRMSSGRSAPHSYSGSHNGGWGSSSRTPCRSAIGGSYVQEPKMGVEPGVPRSHGTVHAGSVLRGGNVVIVNNNNTSKKSTHKKDFFGLTIFITVGLVLVYLLLAFAGGGMVGENRNPITKSTINRKKLHLNISDEAGYFTDECDWILNRTELEKGLKDFYKRTGVLPYVYIIDNVAGDYDPSTQKLEQFAENAYAKLFEDEGHILLLFWDYGGAYEYVLWLGEDTLKLMDTEACDMLFDYLDYYYYNAYTEEAFFSNAFSEAGKRMMEVTHSPIYYVVSMAVIGLGIFVGYKVWKVRHEKEVARKKRAEEILNTPLEKFGTNRDVIDDLEKKYEKEI